MDILLLDIEMGEMSGGQLAKRLRQMNSKISLDREKGITVKADAHVPVSLSIMEIDLCIILGKLFDNAIEACMQLPRGERLIRVYMDMKNTQLYISFTNTNARKKQKTTKGKEHGYGLVRIDTIIERYQGYLNRNSEDGAFSTEISVSKRRQGLSGKPGNLSDCCKTKARPPLSSCFAGSMIPRRGEILLNGINIRKYNYREYMSVFSVVFQDF